MDVENIRQIIEGMIPYVKKTGVRAEVIKPREVTLTLPLDETNLNPLGILHAGATFTLAETACGAVLLTALDPSRVSFINKEMNIRYRKPGRGDLSCSIALSEDEVNSIEKEVEEKGRIDRTFEYNVANKEGVTIAEIKATFNFRKI